VPQLNLNFTDIPIPETHLWEQLDDEQKRIVVEALARLFVKATRIAHQEQASLPVRVPTVEGLPSASFSFASRLRLAVQLRLPSSAPIGSFHPTRFCPCWAHSAAGW
jgi:hypothetical protein